METTLDLLLSVLLQALKSLQAVLDYEEYFLNLTKANADPQNPQWETLFSSVKQVPLLEELRTFFRNTV